MNPLHRVLSTSSLLMAWAFLCLLNPTPLRAASLTWDPDGNLASDGGNGTWDTTSTSWFSAGPTATTFANGDDATFGKKADNSTNLIDIGAGGITVRNITVEPPVGTGEVNLESLNDGDFITVASGGGVWDVNGRTLRIINNDGARDTPVAVGNGDTLVVQSTAGGGIFDTGEKPGAEGQWSASGATLDVRDQVTLRGNMRSVGQFSTVKMSDGTTYFHERNTTEAYANNWELTGDVFFDNTFNVRQYNLDGVVSGTGTVNVKDLGIPAANNGGFVGLRNAGNTFSGGVVIDGTNSRAELNIANAGDGALGAVPGSFDHDNIKLVGGGELKMNGATLNANRGITLDGGGIIVNTANANSYGGTISGTGGLQIGRQAGGDGNNLVLTSNTHTYTGGTRIFQGGIVLGVDDALPTNGVLTIGGKGTSRFVMGGFDQEVAGLQSVGGNTRTVLNDGGSVSVLTINVGSGDSYNYVSNLSGADAVEIVKKGEGTQIFNRGGPFTTAPASLTVEAGVLQIDGNGFSTMTGPVSVTGGVLAGSGAVGGTVTVGAATLAPGLSPGTLSPTDGLILDTLSALDFEFEGTDTTVGSGINDLVDVTGDLTLDGTLNVSEITPGSFLSAAIGDKWRVLSYTGSLVDNGLSLGSLPALSVGAFALEVGGGEVNLAIIPEPTSLMLLGLCCGGGLLFRQTRN